MTTVRKVVVLPDCTTVEVTTRYCEAIENGEAEAERIVIPAGELQLAIPVSPGGSP